MGKIVLLAVAAAWAAVLIPPLLRSRVDNRPNSSVTDFRRQLSTLQRTVPTRGMAPLRSIGRPLAPSGRPVAVSRSVANGRQGPLHRSAVAPPSRAHLHVATLERRPTERTNGQQQAVRPRVSQREIVRRRRLNVLFVLVMSFVLTLLLFATTKTDIMMYAFVLSFFSLMGYCYKLVQLRNQEFDRLHGESHWFNAA